ncbi:MAG: response regulator [Anaerolineae bacterium]
MNSTMRVLLVEDDPNTHELFTMVCDHFGVELNIVVDEAGVMAVLNDQRPDVIVMDIFLPDTDGYKLLQTIRAAQPGLNCPVIATTAYYTTDTMHEVLEAGFSGYLLKPLDPQQIFPYLQQMVAGQ